MSCANCTNATPIPACLNQLIIGNIPDASTAVFVNLRDITAGRVTYFQTTSSNTGDVAIDTAGLSFPVNHSYEIIITKNICGSRVAITIDAETYDCIGVRFEKARDENGDPIVVMSHTIKMDI